MITSRTTITLSDNVRLAVTIWEADTGNSTRDILLLHGWPNAGRVWEPLASQLLLAANYRVFAPDLRGYGGSEKAETGYSCARFADDVVEIAAALGLSDFVFAGHSMSGKIAQIVAARQPAGVAGLVLVTPGLLAPSPPVDVSARRAFHGHTERTRAMIRGFTAHPLPSDVLEWLTEDGLRVGKDAWNGWLSPMRDEDFAADAGSINVPTLVIGGGKDPQRTEEELKREVVGKIKGAQYASLPNSGHLPHVEEPEALALLLANFLDSLPKARTAS